MQLQLSTLLTALDLAPFVKMKVKSSAVVYKLATVPRQLPRPEHTQTGRKRLQFKARRKHYSHSYYVYMGGQSYFSCM